MNSLVIRTTQFLKKKNIEITVQRYLIDVFSYMALGLFSTLLIGTILNTIGQNFNISFLSEKVWPIARDMTGCAIGVGVAYALKAPPLVLFASTVTGAAGYVLGGPVGACLATIFGTEFGKMISKETKVDILLTPATTIVIGVSVAGSIGPVISEFMTNFGKIIMYATELQPFFMGSLVSLLVGIALTLPISSAAICMMLSLGGLAGGAATVGCASQMVGFAIISFKENGWNGILAQGFGTSMIQMGNIIKNWKIWIPSIVSSIILGPISTVVFKMENIPMASGMGTSGLVGQFGTITAMQGKVETPKLYLMILLLHFISPAIISCCVAQFLRRKGHIKEGDLKLDL